MSVENDLVWFLKKPREHHNHFLMYHTLTAENCQFLKIVDWSKGKRRWNQNYDSFSVKVGTLFNDMGNGIGKPEFSLISY